MKEVKRTALVTELTPETPVQDETPVEQAEIVSWGKDDDTSSKASKDVFEIMAESNTERMVRISNCRMSAKPLIVTDNDDLQAMEVETVAAGVVDELITNVVNEGARKQAEGNSQEMETTVVGETGHEEENQDEENDSRKFECSSEEWTDDEESSDGELQSSDGELDGTKSPNV